MTLALFLVEAVGPGPALTLDGDEGRHAATVKRVRPGEQVLVGDGRGMVATCRVSRVGRDSVELEIVGRRTEPAPDPALVVVQALPKGERAERSRVVQQLPALLHVLRNGMATLAIEPSEQDAQIKRLNEAVTRAFVSREEGIGEARLAELSRSLAALEDVVSDDAQGDVLLDPAVIELMFGVDSESIEIISSGGSAPSEAMLQWANELELGNWFALDHRGRVNQVQYVWRSRRGQLHLFAASHGMSYLVQTTRMASYLQAGLLVQLEDEALTVRATREALAKLQGEPDRLLN